MSFLENNRCLNKGSDLFRRDFYDFKTFTNRIILNHAGLPSYNYNLMIVRLSYNFKFMFVRS